MIQDVWGGQLDNFQADLSFDCRRVHLCTREIKIGAKQVDGTILEGDAEDVARKFLGKHEANVVQTEECGETILLPFVVHKVSMTLWQFNIILSRRAVIPGGSRVTRLTKLRFNWTRTNWICLLQQLETCPS